MSKKGIVISPSFKVISDGVRFDGNPSAQDIRKYLLYWDEIDYPNNNVLSVGLSPDLKFLQSRDVLKRTRVTFQGSGVIDPYILISAQEQAFRENEANDPGKWSLAQLSDSQYYTITSLETGIEFELFNCLPVPQSDVPLDDILEFKNKRESELIAFRVHMDKLYQDIINSRNIPRARIAVLDELELAIKDLNRSLDASVLIIYLPP